MKIPRDSARARVRRLRRALAYLVAGAAIATPCAAQVPTDPVRFDEVYHDVAPGRWLRRNWFVAAVDMPIKVGALKLNGGAS